MRSFLKIPYADRNPYANNLGVFLPDEGDSFPVLVYFHGASLIHADYNMSNEAFAQHLTRNGIAIVCANVHTYPNTKGVNGVRFPMFMEDAADVVKWVIDHIGEYCKMEKLVIGGSSCGGYLSAMLCFDKKWLISRGLSPMEIDGFICDSPQLTTHYSVLKEKGFANNRVIIDETAPLFYVGTEKEYPPMLFINATNDSHTRLSQTRLMVTALKNLGFSEPNVQFVTFEGTHCSYVISQEQEAENAFGATLLKFIRSL